MSGCLKSFSSVSWKISTLGEIIERIETTDPRKVPDSEFCYIDVSSVSNRTLKIEETQLLKGVDAPSRARRVVRTNDVIFATVRPTLRRIAIVPDYLDGQVCSTGYFVIRPKSNLDPRFAFFFLQSENFMVRMESLQKGASYPAVTDGEMRSQPIPVPPLPEQERIVSILEEAFAGIATATAHAERNFHNARELFQSVLQSTFEQKGEDWVETTLGEVYDVRDGTHDSPKYQPEGHPLITSKNLKREGLNYDKVKFISDTDFEKINERSKVDRGDVLFAMIGTIGNPVVVQLEPDFAIKNVALFKTGEKDGQFLRYYLESSFVIEKMEREAKGTTQKFVGLGYLRGFPIWVPHERDRKAIVQKLDALAAETRRLEAVYQHKLEAHAELKQSLLQRAFAGEL